MKTVFVSGVFDLLHPGHVTFLEWARSLGDRLVVSVAADATAEVYKRRPVQSAEDRRAMLSSLRAVDYAVIAPVSDRPWADCIPVIEEWMPQVWALGPDDPRADVKRLWATERGIAVIQQDTPKQYSTTALIERVSEMARPGDVVPAWAAIPVPKSPLDVQGNPNALIERARDVVRTAPIAAGEPWIEGVNCQWIDPATSPEIYHEGIRANTQAICDLNRLLAEFDRAAFRL